MQLRSDIIKEALTMLLLMSACMSPHFITPQATNTTIMKNGSQALLTFPGTANVITIKEFNGTYGSSGTSCEGHADNDPWSLSVNGYGGTLTNPVLTVAKGDTDCVLTATSVAGQYTGSGTPDPGTIFTPASAGNFPFTTNNYAGAALAFQSSGTTDFYGNMLITDHTFSGAFTMQLTTSNDPTSITPSDQAYVIVTTTTSNSQVENPTPNYTASVSGLVVDVNNKVLSPTGNLVITAGSQTGEGYVIVNNTTLSTSNSNISTISSYYTSPVTGFGSTITIPLNGALTGNSSLGLAAGTTCLSATTGTCNGATVPGPSNVIIAHTANQVQSYEIITVTFSAGP